MLLLELYRITVLGKALLRKGQKKEAFALTSGELRTAGLKQLREMRNIGDVFVRQPEWEDSLEVGVIKLSKRDCF